MTDSKQLSQKIPYLRSCLEECAQPVKTHIKGQIPKWLSGTLLRNGPGLQQIGDYSYNHIFDGLALIHRFRISDGEVEYQNKFLRSDAFVRNMNAKRIVVSEFGTRAVSDPCKTLWARFMSYFSIEKTDNDNVNLYPIGDQIYAATETNYIRRIDANTLDSHEKVDLSKYVTINTATAHPHFDANNNVYNLGSSFGRNGKYNIFKIPNVEKPLENASIVCSIPMERTLYPSYYHSFSITDNYYIFIEQPLVLSVPTLTTSHISGKAYADCLTWKPDLKTRFHVINREDGKLVNTKYISDPFAFFHTINAFEDENQLIIDICCYPDGQMVSAFSKQTIKDSRDSQKSQQFNSEARSEVRRYVLPLMDHFLNPKPDTNLVNLDYTTATAVKSGDSSIQLKHESLTPSGPVMGELPRINYKKFNGKKYRYFYSLARGEADNRVQLMKFDISNKKSLIWSEENASPSEPVFIESPNSSPENDKEDDGVILSSVLSELDETKGFLLVLNANTFEEIARAEFQTKSAITGDFHGIFVQ